MKETKRVPRIAEKYRKETVSALIKEFAYSNRMKVPRLEKVVVNMGIKEGKDDVKILETHVAELSLITGQKPLVTKAKKSIANFKVRQGQPIGAKVTLRGVRMYEFVDRLFNIAMPRIRDFQGYHARSFDGRGNYTLGIQEQLIFPELEFDKIRRMQGMDITFVTSASSDAEARRLLELLGLPFIKKQKAEG